MGDSEPDDAMHPAIVQLLVSPVHRYDGRPADGPRPVATVELVDTVRIRAGLGIVGDRYFNKPTHRDVSVTVIAAESLPPGADLVQVRRNILVRSIDIDTLVGSVLSLDSGDGPVMLQVRRAANPCAWMNVVIGDGAWRAMRGKGGVRCVPLNDGVLRLGPVDVVIN